jgi:hypothetical protein
VLYGFFSAYRGIWICGPSYFVGPIPLSRTLYRWWPARGVGAVSRGPVATVFRCRSLAHSTAIVTARDGRCAGPRSPGCEQVVVYFEWRVICRGIRVPKIFSPIDLAQSNTVRERSGVVGSAWRVAHACAMAAHPSCSSLNQ